MTKRVLMVLMVLALMVVLLPAAAIAGDGNNGQAIGQDELRLTLTKCSNAGNGGEFESAIFFWSKHSDCFAKRGFYSWDEVVAIKTQSTCIGFFPLFGSCEVDPGNSAAHNANN